MMFSPWIRTGTSPEELRRMNQGSLCSLSGRFTSCSSHCSAFSAIASRTWNGTDTVTGAASPPGPASEHPRPLPSIPHPSIPQPSSPIPQPFSSLSLHPSILHPSVPPAPPPPRAGRGSVHGGRRRSGPPARPSPSARRRTVSSGTAPAAPCLARLGSARPLAPGVERRPCPPRAEPPLGISRRGCPGDAGDTRVFPAGSVRGGQPFFRRGNRLQSRLQHPLRKRRKMDAQLGKVTWQDLAFYIYLGFVLVSFFFFF